jgi:hypothetical protein
LFKFKSKIPDFERGKAKILTTPEEWAPHSTGQAGIHRVFRGLKFESDPSEIGFAFHGTSAGIGQKGVFSKASRKD